MKGLIKRAISCFFQDLFCPAAIAQPTFRSLGTHQEQGDEPTNPSFLGYAGLGANCWRHFADGCGWQKLEFLEIWRWKRHSA